MDIEGVGALVVGGASGLGEATARALVERGAKVTIADWNEEKGDETAQALEATFVKVDVREDEQVTAAVESVEGLKIAVNCAGVGWPEKTAGSKGPHQTLPFRNVVEVNLFGTFNVLRAAGYAMLQGEPNAGGERGVIVNTASVAAFDGQIGQLAYSASKGGVVGMTLPAARDLSRYGVRVVTIAPGLFDTPLLGALPQEQRDALGQQVPFPPRLGQPDEYAALAVHIAENPMLNGETIRLDGAIRMAPK